MNIMGVEPGAITVALTILLGLLGLFAAMALFARNYIKVPPSMVAILYGRKHSLVDEKGNRSTVGFRVVRGGAALRVPVLEQVEYLSLNVISIPLKIQRAYTKEGVPVTVEAVANVKIAGDDMSLRNAAERFLGMTTDQIKGVIFQTLEGHLRAILGTLTVEEINDDRSAFAQKVTDEETRIDQVRKQQEVLVQEQEAARKEKELQATVVKPAEAERQAAILRAEGEKQATIIRAEATQKELEFKGTGEAARIEKIGRAEAAKVLAVGEAEAEVIKKKLLAEAEGLQKKAEAWKNFNEAAVINMVVEKMPDLAQAFATQLAGIDKINIIEMGNGSAGSGGIGKVMSTVGGGMTAMLSMLKDEFGIDIARLMQAKTEAAAEEADKKAGKR